MVVEVLTMLKFWKSNPNSSPKLAPKTTVYSQTTVTSTVSDHHLTDDSDDDDDDDSFFELELSSPSPQQSHHDHHHHHDHGDDEVKVFKKPQSPMSVLRSASPKFFKNVMMMMVMKKNSRVEDFTDTDSVSESFYSPKRISTGSATDTDTDTSFAIKFKIEDGSIVPKLARTRSNNSTTSISKSPKIESRNDGVSKRFSKDTVQKYLNNMIKPKTALKKYNNGGCSRALMKEREEKQSASRFKTKCKQLGKCKSASAVVGDPSPVSFPARSDFPADGIEGAILHCKRSLTSSTIDYSSLSRCSSDPSYDKSIKVPEVCR